MLKLICPLLVLAAALVGCQPTTSSTTATSPSTTPAVSDEAAARLAVNRFIRTQPDAELYVPDSASVINTATHWQVLVPRIDWAERMPNRARFEVDKQTGKVSSQPVK